MTKVDENIQTAQNLLSGMVERCYELEEENKKLRELKCVPSNLKTVIRIDKENDRLEKENKRLKASRDYWKEKAEKIIKEKEYYKKKAREYELALKIEYSDKPDLYKLIFGDEQL